MYVYIYIYIYIYKFITNEDEPLLFCLTPIFRPHLVVFFRVTKKPLTYITFKIAEASDVKVTRVHKNN